MSLDIQKITNSIKGLTQDSRAVQKGFLFAAFPGTQSDGRNYIQSAIKSGATMILAPEGTELPSNTKDVQLITAQNPRQIFAYLAAAFYKHQPENIVAVTGTNGKTSVVTFLEQLWQAAGHKATSLGTLKGARTTPDPVALHEQLAAMAKDGITHLAIEASSHGLDQYRLDGVEIKAAGFTNITHDHLDYHGDMDAYYKAKERLFSEVLACNPSNIAKYSHLNADIAYYNHLKESSTAVKYEISSYGYKADTYKVMSITPTPHGQKLELEIRRVAHTINLPLVGEFQAMNALCALGLAVAINSENESTYIQALESLKNAQGRLENVQGHPGNAAVYVDYAHTPDALENILKALRPHTKNKLVCLFGCGGDRDCAKRPLMGEISAQYADKTIVTDDNPRNENPSNIRSQILSAAPNATEIPNRQEAIRTAIEGLGQGDVLVIAGKGHEQGQTFADHTDPFDDVTEARKAINNLKTNPSIK